MGHCPEPAETAVAIGGVQFLATGGTNKSDKSYI